MIMASAVRVGARQIPVGAVSTPEMPGSYTKWEGHILTKLGFFPFTPRPSVMPELNETSRSLRTPQTTQVNANPRSSRVTLIKTLKVGYKSETLLFTAVGTVQLKCDGTR